MLESDYPNLEVIFFDNGSTDDSVQFVKQRFQTDARLRIRGIPKNCGPGAGNNKAMEHTRGKYVAFLNNDVEMESGSIRELVKAMEKDSAIGIATSKIMFFDRRHINTVGNLLDLTMDSFCIGYNEEDQGQYDSVFEPTFPSGACMLLRRSMIERIGLFDPNYFFYHDDSDVGMRARLAGYKVMYVPSSVAYHKEGGTSSSSLEKNELIYHTLKSRVGLFTKNLEFKSILKLGIPMFVKYALDVSAFFLRGGAMLAAKSVLWSLANFKNDWKRRQIIQKRIRRVSDDELFKYFLGYSVFLFLIKTARPLRYIAGHQGNPVKFVKRFIDAYYRNHISHS